MLETEPQEKWTGAERAEFEVSKSRRTRQMLRSALLATVIFAATVLAIIPFLEGHSLHSHWETVGKYLVLLAMAELLWFVLRWGYVWSSWQSARETLRETRDED